MEINSYASTITGSVGDYQFAAVLTVSMNSQLPKLEPDDILGYIEGEIESGNIKMPCQQIDITDWAIQPDEGAIVAVIEYVAPALCR